MHADLLGLGRAGPSLLRRYPGVIGTTQSDVGCNRRQVLEDGRIALGQNPWCPYDPTMTAIRFVRDGKPYADILHYGAHPTAIGKMPDINGSIDYIATRDSLHRGGYEVQVAKAFSPYLLAENIDDILIGENLRLLRKLAACKQ